MGESWRKGNSVRLRVTDTKQNREGGKKETTLERETATAPLDTNCQTEECMIDHMSFIYAQFNPPRWKGRAATEK